MAQRQRGQPQARIAMAAAKSESTASRVLARAGLSKLRALAPGGPVQRNAQAVPQDILHVGTQVAVGEPEKRSVPQAQAITP